MSQSAPYDKKLRQFSILEKNDMSMDARVTKFETLSDREYKVFFEAYCMSKYYYQTPDPSFTNVLSTLFYNGFYIIAEKLIKENSDYICFDCLKILVKVEEINAYCYTQTFCKN